jgi:hypothetical protein
MKKLQIGLTRNEELELIGRLQYRETKDISLEWLINFREWKTKADLTFRSLAAPERAEKAVRLFLCKFAPGAWALVGYERQERGAVHAHMLIDRIVHHDSATAYWKSRCGFCRINRIRKGRGAMEDVVFYAVKHGIKNGDWDIFGPGSKDNWLHRSEMYSTGEMQFDFSPRPPMEGDGEKLLQEEWGKLISKAQRQSSAAEV